MNQLLARYALFYPPRYARGEYVGRYLTDVARLEHRSFEEVAAEQWSRLRLALTRAAADIPYYARLFASTGIDPTRIREPDDLVAIPLLDKAVIRAHRGEMDTTRRVRKAARSTSGSTGTPFIFEKDAVATAYIDAVMYHVYGWHGIEIGAPQARFWGMPFTPRARAIARVKDVLMNRVRCNAFALGEADLTAFHRRLSTFHPQYFYGYPSLIYEFARHVASHHLQPLRRQLKAVIGTGELVVPEQRQFIEETFNAPFVNEYGCSEAGIIGFECPRGGMHVMAQSVYVEVLQDGRPVVDEEGEVVVTELHARTQPFIRYRMHDRGVMLSERCPCGRPFPLIQVTSGRIDGYLTLPSGGKVYDALFAYTLKKGVAAFKAVQTGPATVHIYVVPDDVFSESLLQHHLEVLRHKTFGEIEFAVTLVQALPRERSGKLRYFVNELTSGRGWSADASPLD